MMVMIAILFSYFAVVCRGISTWVLGNMYDSCDTSCNRIGQVCTHNSIILPITRASMASVITKSYDLSTCNSSHSMSDCQLVVCHGIHLDSAAGNFANPQMIEDGSCTYNDIYYLDTFCQTTYHRRFCPCSLPLTTSSTRSKTKLQLIVLADAPSPSPSIVPSFTPTIVPMISSSTNLSLNAIIGVVLGIIFGLLLLISSVWFCNAYLVYKHKQQQVVPVDIDVDI